MKLNYCRISTIARKRFCNETTVTQCITLEPGRIGVAGHDELEETVFCLGSFNYWDIANGRRIRTVFKAESRHMG